MYSKPSSLLAFAFILTNKFCRHVEDDIGFDSLVVSGNRDNHDFHCALVYSTPSSLLALAFILTNKFCRHVEVIAVLGY
ncbi:MAG: hypothetical protein AB1Z23_12200 [Eubacteriales bacterium]